MGVEQKLMRHAMSTTMDRTATLQQSRSEKPIGRRRRRLGRVQIQAIALVIGWFSLLLVALWSEIAVVGAVQRAIKRATFLHSSPPGHDGKPFRR